MAVPFSIAVRLAALGGLVLEWALPVSSQADAVPCTPLVLSPAAPVDPVSAPAWAHGLVLVSGLASVSAPGWARRDWRRLRLLAMRPVRPDLARVAAVASSTPRPKKAR